MDRKSTKLKSHFKRKTNEKPKSVSAKESNNDNSLVKLSTVQVPKVVEYLDSGSLVMLSTVSSQLLKLKDIHLKKIYIRYSSVESRGFFFFYYNALIPRKENYTGFKRYFLNKHYEEDDDYTRPHLDILNWDRSPLQQSELRNTFEKLLLSIPRGNIPRNCGVEFSSCNCVEILSKYKSLYMEYSNFPYDEIFETCMDEDFLENMKNLNPEKFLSETTQLSEEEFLKEWGDKRKLTNENVPFYVLKHFKKFLSMYVNLIHADNYTVKQLIDRKGGEPIPTRECKDDSNRHVFDCFVKLYSYNKFAYSKPRWSDIEEYSGLFITDDYEFGDIFSGNDVETFDVCGFLNPETKKVCSEVANRINRYNVASGCNILSYRCDQCSDDNNWTTETVQIVFGGEHKIEEFSDIITEEEYIEFVDGLDRSRLAVVYEEIPAIEIDSILDRVLALPNPLLEDNYSDSW